MKIKTLASIFLLALFIPQVVFAAWWNPFSWKIFHRTQNTRIEKPLFPSLSQASSSIDAVQPSQPKPQVQNPAPVLIKSIPQPNQPSLPTIESWEQVEARNFIYANQMRWTAMVITHPTTGEKRYYRKEDNQWVRKNTENEALQPYQSVTQPVTQPVFEPAPIANPTTQTNQNITSELETRYAAEALKWETNYKNMVLELAPYKEQIAALKAKEKEVGCDIVDMSRIIGSIAQQCNILLAEEGIILAKQGVIMAKYGYGNTVTSPSFNVQQSVSGRNYTFYYDGYGSGSVYNTSNPADSYKIYCSYGRCDIYGQ